jgi:hypothetical protein
VERYDRAGEDRDSRGVRLVVSDQPPARFSRLGQNSRVSRFWVGLVEYWNGDGGHGDGGRDRVDVVGGGGWWLYNRCHPRNRLLPGHSHSPHVFSWIRAPAGRFEDHLV